MEFNLADLWEQVAATVPDRDALVEDERRLSYREVDARATALARELLDRGVTAGDHVAVYASNCVEYLEAMIAAFKIRAVPFNVNYRYIEEELRYLLDDADAVAVVFQRRFAPLLAAIRDRLPRLRVFVAVADGSDAPLDDLDALDYDAVVARPAAPLDVGPRSADDLYVLYTGGTTGMPKGVVWRHEDAFFGAFGGGGSGGAAVSTPEEIADRARAGRTRCLPACPFMHGTAHWMAFMTLFGGGTVVIAPDPHFDPVRLWRLIAAEQVGFLVIVGDAFARPLVDALAPDGPVDPASVSCCRVMLSGGAILSPSVKEALAERLPGTLVVDGYGASETGGQGQSVTVAGGEIPASPRFRVTDETAVLDDHLRPVQPGDTGWLARSGHVPLGYYKDPAKTAATFPVVDGVRWAVPGDHARLEADGTITLLGRGSVSINTGGEKVYPEEVEAALKSHPDVFDAVVVGVPDDRWGERVVAVVQARPGRHPDAAALRPHARAHLAGYKVPRAVVAVDEIVRAPSGKPDYRWARATAAASSSEGR